ncbi:MAG: response regulator [Mangrovicoccus sp.]
MPQRSSLIYPDHEVGPNTPILCLDDEVLIALDTADVLTEEGYRSVFVAHTERAAERILDENAIGLAILDVNLGDGQNSYDVARKVLAQGGYVIFATGYTKPVLPPELRGRMVISKPVNERTLRSAIAALGAD